MKGYRLDKRYILKKIISRIVIIGFFNIAYFIGKVYVPNKKIDFCMLILLYVINAIGGLVIFITPFIEFWAYKYFISNDAIEIRYGVLFRKSVYIPRNNIKYIIAVKDPLDRVLRISSLKIYTTAGHSIIKALGSSKMSELWNIMDVYGECK